MCAYVTHIWVHIATDTWSSAPLCVLQPSHEEGGFERPPDVSRQLLEIRDPGPDSADPLHMQLLIPTHTVLRPARASGPPLRHSHSRESVHSLRRASSLHDIDGTRDQWSGMSVCACTHLVPSVKQHTITNIACVQNFIIYTLSDRTGVKRPQVKFKASVSVTSCLSWLIEKIKMISHP